MALGFVDFPHSDIIANIGIAPVALTTVNSPVNGTAVDCGGGVGPVAMEVFTGVFTSPGTLDVKLQEAKEDPANLGSPLSTDWTDVAGATATQVVANNSDQSIFIKNVVKRFVRPVATIVGGGASVLGCVIIHIPLHMPPSGTGSGVSNSPLV